MLQKINVQIPRDANGRIVVTGKRGVEQYYHKDAFEYYWSMQNRSIRTCARELGIQRTTVDHWAKKFNWAARVKEREDTDEKLKEVAPYNEVSALRKRIFAAYKAEIGDLVEYDEEKKTFRIKGVMDPKKAQYLKGLVEGLDNLIKDREQKQSGINTAQQINVIIKK